MIYEVYGKCICDFGGYFYLSVVLYFVGIFKNLKYFLRVVSDFMIYDI